MRKKTIINTLIAVLMLCMTGCGTEDKIEKQLVLAEEYMDNREYSKAIEAFDKVIELDQYAIEAYEGKLQALVNLEVENFDPEKEEVRFEVEEDGTVVFTDVPDEIEDVIEETGEVVQVLKREEKEIYEDKERTIKNFYIIVNHVVKKDPECLLETTGTVVDLFEDDSEVADLYRDNMKNLAEEYMSQGELTKALEYAVTLQEVFPEDEIVSAEVTEIQTEIAEREEEIKQQEAEKAEKEEKQRELDEALVTLDSALLSYYGSMQGNPLESGVEYTFDDLKLMVMSVIYFVEQNDLYDYIEGKCSVSSYEELETNESGSYVFTPEGSLGGEKLGFYFSNTGYFSLARNMATIENLSNTSWKYGMYYGEYDNGLRHGQGTMYCYEKSSDEVFWSYSGDWSGDLPQGAGYWEMKIHQSDQLERIEECAEVTADKGVITGQFQISIWDKAGNPVYGAYTIESGSYVKVNSDEYVLNKNLNLEGDGYVYGVCYNTHGVGVLVLIIRDEGEYGMNHGFRYALGFRY